MFESLIKVADNVQKLDRDRILSQVFEDVAVRDEIRNLNIEQMYDFGVGNDGVTLGQYTFRTKQTKEFNGQRFDHITLRDTEEFHDSIRVGSDGKNIVITGDMQKPDQNLEIRFPNALGLTEENWNFIRESIIPNIRQIVMQEIKA